MDGHDIELWQYARKVATFGRKCLMSENNDRTELERRLEQVRRLSHATDDTLTKQRFDELARDIEQQLSKPH